jgi:RNA polymerase sigma-70 factor (sigma-E family)
VKKQRDEEFRSFVAARRSALVRTATLLCGDEHFAEDLTQIALTKLYVAWQRARRLNVDAYVRRILVNALIDEKRRPFAKRESARADVPERSRPDDDQPSVDPEDALLIALARLAPRMRTAVVLRHVHDLSVEETADAMGCSTGTVKSQTARGLDKLRDLLTPPSRLSVALPRGA